MTTRYIVLLCLMIGVSSTTALSQNTSITMGDEAVKQNAVLFLNSVNKNQGLIIPIVTTRDVIDGGPEAGMVVFDESEDKVYYHDGIKWVEVGGDASEISGLRVEIVGNSIRLINGSDVINSTSIVTHSGTVEPGQLVMWNGQKWVTTSDNLPNTHGQILQWNNTTKIWEPGTAGTTGDMTKSVYDANNDNVVDVSAGVMFQDQNPNLILASPTENAGQPAFRPLNDSDIPGLDASKISAGTLPISRGGTGLSSAPVNGQILAAGDQGYTLKNLKAGIGIAIDHITDDITISATGSLTNPMTTEGDIITGGSSGIPSRIAIGQNGQVLTVDGAIPIWKTPAELAGLNSVSGGVGGSIQDGSVTNDDISPAAAIQGTKIVPDFGSQNVSTTGGISAISIATGNLSTINSVGYLWPSNQGSASSILTNDGTGSLSWEMLTEPSNELTAGHILVGNSSNVAAGVPLTGDATINELGQLTLSGDAVTGSNIVDGSISNEDIGTSAAIDGSKITPDFGGQNISTTGSVLANNIISGNIAQVNNVSYTWPGTQGVANSVLANDGSGALTWSSTPALSPSLSTGNLFVGSSANLAAGVPLTGDATLNSTGALTIATDAVNSAKIANGSIVNQDINAAAAISGTKVSPNFGSQNISTTGNLTVGGTTTINSRTYAWPSTAAAAGTVLTNNGSGTLSWSASSSSASTALIAAVIAGENITAGNVVYFNLKDGKAYLSSTSMPDKIRANGISTQTRSSGQTVMVQTFGTYALTGLTTNMAYYLSADGTISTTPTAVRIGNSVSSTELNINVVQDDRDAIGIIKSYAKNFPGVPSNNLTAFWIECNGQVLSDSESPLNGSTIPNINANLFLRGNSTSGGTGGSSGHLHNMIATGSPPSGKLNGGNTAVDYYRTFTDSQSNIPPYYDIVFIIKVK